MAASIENFYAKYSEILLHNSMLGENGVCQIWTGGKKVCKNNYVFGILNVTFPDGKRTKINVARLSKMMQYKTLSFESNIDSSHLCHNPLCILPEHINMEPHTVNNTRQFCVHNVKCSGHTMNGVVYPECLISLKMWCVFLDKIILICFY